MIWLGLYIGCIVGANWALTTFGLLPVAGLLIPAGTLFAGLSFTARDFTQDVLGRRGVFVAIGVGAALSALLSPALALASGLAFLLSETVDMGVYTPLARRQWIAAVVCSNIVGSLIDSALFLWLAFGSLDFLAGQLVGKWAMTLLVLPVLWLVRRQRTPEVADAA
jgi:uncharacterized PurR-regulated membrane protein YhhQ (DUF165 family)